MELCSAKCFGLLLCVTIFWRRGWPRSHPYHRLIPSNRPTEWVPLGQMENTTTVLHQCPWNYCWQSQTSFASSPCRAGCSRHLRYLIRHWDHLHGGAYCAEHALLSSEELTIRNTHLSPGSSSAKRIDCSIRHTTTPTGRALWLR